MFERNVAFLIVVSFDCSFTFIFTVFVVFSFLLNGCTNPSPFNMCCNSVVVLCCTSGLVLLFLIRWSFLLQQFERSPRVQRTTFLLIC